MRTKYEIEEKFERAMKRHKHRLKGPSMYPVGVQGEKGNYTWDI